MTYIFRRAWELPYIDYYQGAAAKKQSIAVEVMTPLYLDGRCISSLISSPEDIDVLAVGYCLAEEKIPAGRKLAGVCLHDGAAWVTTEAGTARAVEKPPFVPITAEKLCSYGGLLDSLSTAHHGSHGVHEGPWSKAMKSASIRKISAATMSSIACGASSNYSTSTSVRPSWSSAAVFPNRSSKRSMAWAFASWHRGSCRRVWACPLAEQCQITLACGLRPDSFKIFAHPELGFCYRFLISLFCYNMKRDSWMVVHRLSLLICRLRKPCTAGMRIFSTYMLFAN